MSPGEDTTGAPLARPSGEQLQGPPSELVAALSARWGNDRVARYCAGLLQGDDPLLCREALLFIGGRGAVGLTGLGDGREALRYWPRVWAARALRYAWSPTAVPALVTALDDESWRVAEQSMKVMARYEVGEGVDAALRWVDHPLPRVRATTLRLLGAVGESEHIGYVLDARHDPASAVCRAAERALSLLERRLDMELRR
jgi:hypothetical protein